MMDNDRDHHHHNIYDGWVVLSVVGQLKWNSNVYYGLWVGRIVHELYDFLTDDDELMMMILLLLLQLFFKSLCRFLFIYLFIYKYYYYYFGGGKYETGSFEKRIWGRNAAMNFKNRPDIRQGYVPVSDNRPHGSLNHP
jgi:hypothetical protein